MSELSNGLGGDAPKHTVQANGKTYQVGLVTQDIKIGYEKALYAKARDGVAVFRKDMDREDYVGMLKDLAADYEAGAFAIEGERGRKAIQSPGGAVLLLSLLMGVDQAEVVNALLASEDELLSVFQVVMKESFPGVKFEGSEVPKA